MQSAREMGDNSIGGRDCGRLVKLQQTLFTRRYENGQTMATYAAGLPRLAIGTTYAPEMFTIKWEGNNVIVMASSMEGKYCLDG